MVMELRSSTLKQRRNRQQDGASGSGPPTHLVKISSVIAFYFVVSLSIVFLNKKLMSVASHNKSSFPYPLFVTWAQMWVTLSICLITGALGTTIKLFSFMPPISLDRQAALRVLPVAFTFVLMICMNNLTLAHVRVSFYQVARSTSLFFNIIFIYILFGETTSLSTIASCCVMVIGFIVGSHYEKEVSIVALAFGVLSSVFGSLYGIGMKRVLTHVGGNQWILLQYTSMYAIVLMFPILVISGEWSDALASPAMYDIGNWSMISLSGVFGFLISIAILLLVKYTSPLTYHVSGIAKACAQPLMGILLFQETVSTANLAGLVLTTAGSMWYSYLGYVKMQADKGHKGESR